MTTQEKDATRLHLVKDPDRRQVFIGLLGITMLYAMTGVLMVLISNVFATLPLNTPDVYDAIGRMDHVYGVRLGTSTAFFVLAGLTFIVAVEYSIEPTDNLTKWYARILAILMQPWIYLAALIIGLLWILQAMEPDGDIAEFFAGMAGIDNTSYYRYLMGIMPSLEFLMFGVGGLMIVPFTSHASELLLQDTGIIFNKIRKVPMTYDDKARAHVARNMLQAGLFFVIIGVGLYGIGYVLGIGIDVTWPIFKLGNYPLFLSVYLWFPIACGGFCIWTAIIYFAKPDLPVSRACAWCTVVLGCVLPLYGWYSSIVIGRELWITGGRVRLGQERKEMYVGIVSAIAAIVISAIYVLMLSA
nr:hypothetical protein [Candidatus Sigynarchaeota archaeon]